MGQGEFKPEDYVKQAQEAKASENSGFEAKAMCDEFNPARVEMRYSKRGPFNEFRDVITILIGLDVTGSMDAIPKALLEGKLGSLMVDLKNVFNRPNENLQLSFAAIGDAKTDESPLQVTHFESDNRFAKQLQKLYLEKHGGANGAESYNLLWWYAANKTHLNYVKQDGRKGILITIGDDNVHPELTAGEIQMWLDPKYDGENISNQVLLNAVRQQYDVYHIVITDGDAYNYDALRKRAPKSQQQKSAEAKQWKDLLGENNVLHANSEKVADAIADIIKRHRPKQRDDMKDLKDSEWSKKNKETLTDAQWIEVLSYALCPLCHQYMTNPVTLGNDKRAFQKEAIEKFVNDNQMDPITHKKLTPAELVLKPNLNIAQMCENYKSYFYALPDVRRDRLVRSALSEIVHERQKKVEDSDHKPRGFFEKEKRNAEEIKLDNFKICLECSIANNGKPMDDPVMVVESGQTYERREIEKWFQTHDTDPNTMVTLKSKAIVTNYALKSLCDQARATQAKP